MKTSDIITLITFTILALLGVMLGYQAGYSEGEEYGQTKEILQHVTPTPPPNPMVPENRDSDEIEMELARQFLDGIKSANITFEYDDTGYTHVIISIYYERDEASSNLTNQIPWNDYFGDFD